MAGRFVIARESRKFADQLSALLNGTVSCGVRLRCTDSGAQPPYRVSSERPLPLTLDLRKKPTAFLRLSYGMSTDKSGRFLMVNNSLVALSRDADGRKLLLHYDYERDKPGYPDAPGHRPQRLGSACGEGREEYGRLQLVAALCSYKDDLPDLAQSIGWNLQPART